MEEGALLPHCPQQAKGRRGQAPGSFGGEGGHPRDLTTGNPVLVNSARARLLAESEAWEGKGCRWREGCRAPTATGKEVKCEGGMRASYDLVGSGSKIIGSSSAWGTPLTLTEGGL